MKKIKFTQTRFLENCKKAHGNKYDYSKSIYKRCDIPVIIICPDHGEFKQLPLKHCNAKQGCPLCSGNVKKTRREIICQFKKKHGDKYDYSQVKYKNTHTKVKIICPEHGEFFQSPHNHLLWGCKKCSGVQKLTTEEFIKRAKKIHGDIYDYSKVEYKSSFGKVKIICPNHSEFEQRARAHASVGNGCPICKMSKGEKAVFRFLSENNVKFIPQKKFRDCRDKRMLPFDFYLPKLNICIEFDGEQHFREVELFGGKEEFENRERRDKIKTKYCKEKGIKLFRIKYNMDVNSFLSKRIL